MPANLTIDDKLIREALRFGRHRTKQDAVNAALDEYIGKRKQPAVLGLFGQIDYDERYDDRQARKSKRR